MNSQPPLISVIMPVHNAAPYLREAVKSIQAQTLGDFEIIAVTDNATTDESPAILASIATGDARLKTYHLANDVGLVPALNEGIRQATGRYIARMDADDVIPPDRFEKQVAFLLENPHIGVVSGGYALMDSNGTFLNRTHNTEFKSPEVVKWGLYFGTTLCHGAAMFHTEKLRQSGGYRAEYQYVEDHDLFVRMSRITKMASIPDTLYYYRVKREGSISTTQSAEQTRLGGLIRQELVYEVLNRRLSLEASILMQSKHRVEWRNLQDALAASETILDLYRYHLNHNPQIAIPDKKIIYANAHQRIRVMLRRFPLHGWFLCARLFFIK